MIKFDNVNFTYRAASVEHANGLKNISLAIAPGECVVITGKSGCGKSTLLKTINGIIPNLIEGKIEGTVTVKGRQPKDLRIQELAKDVGSVFQNPKSQFFHLNTSDEITFASCNLKLDREEVIKRLHRTAGQMNIEHLLDKRIFDLSGGEKQRIACASAYAHTPDIIIMDEPSSNLDHQSIEKLKAMIVNMKKQGKTIVIAEHRLYYLMDIADRFILLKDGMITDTYSPNQLCSLSDDERHRFGLRTCVKPEISLPKATNQNAETALSVDALSVWYDNYCAIDLSQKFKKHHVTAIVGQNGAGKSTFAKALCGLVDIKGTISGEDILSRKSRNKQFFMVMQDVNHQLFSESVLDELMLGHEDTEENEKRALDILVRLDLLDYKDTHPLSLSGGQKQRVAIATAIFSGCDYLIFDEPTSGLDYEHMKRFAKLIDSVKHLVKLVIIITHDYELINLACDDVVKLDKGGKMKQKSSFSMVLGFAKSQKYKIVLSSIFSVFSSLFSIAPYFLIIAIIDLITNPNYSGPSLEQLITWSIGAGVLFTIFFLAGTMLSHVAAFSVLHEIRVNVVKHLGHLPIGFFKHHSSGLIKKSMDEDVEKLELFIAHQIPDLVENLVVPLTIIIYLMFKNWMLGLLLLVPLIAFMLLQGIMMSKYGDGMREYVDHMNAMHGAIVEYIHGMNVFKAFNMGASRFKTYKKSTEAYLKIWKRITNDTMIYQAISFVIVDSGLIFTLPVGGILYVNGLISGIDFIAFLFLSSVFLNGLTKLLFMSQSLQILLMGADNIKNIIETKEQRIVGEKIDGISGEVVISDLSFAYEENDVLKDVNLTFKAGTMNALVGKSGSGKTTLGMLLGRFYDTGRDMISIDGIDIQDIEFKSLMDNTAFVFQDTFLMSDTIYNNILLGLNRTKEEVISAAKSANIHDFIMSLAEGYDTVIGDGSGIKMSGGEKQRISIARAMLKNAPIVILDEVTSYSDIENELEIQDAIRRLLKNRTSVIIAHRLYTIKDADQIVVLDEGSVVQKGKHDDLVNVDGPYQNFWKGGLADV